MLVISLRHLVQFLLTVKFLEMHIDFIHLNDSNLILSLIIFSRVDKLFIKLKTMSLLLIRALQTSNFKRNILFYFINVKFLIIFIVN